MSRATATTRISQEDRRAEAERRLLAAAAETIGEVGPSRMTLAMVGERAGYSRGLASHYFGSKSALMQRVVDEVTESFIEALEPAVRSDDPLEAVRVLIDTYFDIISDLSPLQRARLVLNAEAVATDSPDVRPAMVASGRFFRREIEKAIERATAAGSIEASVDPAALATVIVGMLRGVAFQAMIDDEVDLEACRKEVERLLLDRAPPER